MSMSQEEIEALMNGLDISEEKPSEDVSVEENTVNTEEIEELISQAEDINVEEVSEESKDLPELESLEETISDDIEEEPEDLSVSVSNDDIDDLLKDLEGDVALAESTEVNNDFDDLLADIDGIVESTGESENSSVEESIDDNPVVEAEAEVETSADVLSETHKNEIAKDWTDSKIDEGVFPLPAEQDTKVVNQLSQVANDSEEKVGQIFDVLSLTLDNNNDFRAKIKSIESFLENESKLLSSLNQKFPNINVFDEHLNSLNSLTDEITTLKSSIDQEDMKIFEAMELMQFNDINRQKIERVMAVIRKLSLYLNNLFEDDSGSPEIVVAKHIHGDNNTDLIGDDLDKLIEEFGK